jgi:hypothetical protein
MKILKLFLVIVLAQSFQQISSLPVKREAPTSENQPKPTPSRAVSLTSSGKCFPSSPKVKGFESSHHYWEWES